MNCLRHILCDACGYFVYTEIMTKLFVSEMAGIVIVTLGAVLFAMSPLAHYDIQLLAVLFIVYFLFRNVFSRMKHFYVIETLVFIFVIVATVFSTGGVRSPFFFLLYFLLFASSLLLESGTSLVLTLMLVIAFLGSYNASMTLQQLLPVFSLPFITPFAKYAGDMQRKYFKQREELEHVVAAKSKLQIQKNYQEEQTLLFLTTMLYRHIDDLKERTDNFLGDHDLQYVRHKVKELSELLKNFRDYVEKI